MGKWSSTGRPSCQSKLIYNTLPKHSGWRHRQSQHIRCCFSFFIFFANFHDAVFFLFLFLPRRRSYGAVTHSPHTENAHIAFTSLQDRRGAFYLRAAGMAGGGHRGREVQSQTREDPSGLVQSVALGCPALSLIPL